MADLVGKTILHYKVIEKLGQGGMGVVYRAEDTKLKRDVAIKFLPHEIAVSEKERNRFRMEAQAAGALNHPYIATIYAIEETGDEMFIVMEYIDGRELKEIVDIYRDAPMQIDEIIKYATQIAEGLQAAHKKGIVHRDIKSANIMITDEGKVKIMDFGLAKVRGGPQLTKEGTSIGTIAYMSPEQARGEEVDHRTDIWAFGAVIYEMVAGRQPFVGDYEQAVIYSILNEAPKPLASLRNETPPELERIVLKSLSKEKRDRYQQTDNMLQDLKTSEKNLESGKPEIPVAKHSKRDFSPARLLAFFGVLIAAVALTLTISWVLSGKEESIDSKSVAVLPFDNMSGEKDSDYFSEGITEDIITQLSRIGDLSVISRSSVMRYKDSDKLPHEIGEELGVGTLLEGSIRRAGKQIRITAQLIDANTNRQIWAEAYDREMQDIFAIQNDVAQSIAAALEAELSAPEKEQILKRPTKDPEAYNLYLQGRYFWTRRHQGGLQKALEFFQQAIDKDPDYALGHAGVADCYNILTVFGYIDPEVGIPTAKRAALKAIELDKTLAEPYASLAWCNLSYDYELAEAEKKFQHAIKLNPRYVTARYWHAVNLSAMGTFEEAIAEAKKAVELEPLSLVANFILAMVYYMDRQYDTAIKQFHITLEMDPNYLAAHFYLGWVYLATAEYNKAIQTFQKTVTFSEGAPAFVGYLGAAYGMAGQSDKAQQILRELLLLSDVRYVSPYYRALVYHGLNDPDKAFEWLRKAYEKHEPLLSLFKFDPFWDGLRTDPRYDGLLQKMGLDQWE